MTIVQELRALADCDARAGEPLGKCMREAADVIETLTAALQEIVARNEIQHWFNLDQARAAIARATA